MSQPRIRKTFDRDVPKYAPDSKEVHTILEYARSGKNFDSKDIFLPNENDVEIFDDNKKNNNNLKTSKVKTFFQKFRRKKSKTSKKTSNMKARILTGAIYIILTIACLLLSNITTALYLAVMSAICAGEFYYMLRSDAKLPNEAIGISASALFPIAMWLFGPVGVFFVFMVLIIVLLCWYVFWLRARISDVAISLFGAIYTGMAMSMALLISMALPDRWGGLLLVGIFMSIWANDVFAYLVGSAIGKHKMAPHISPKKSWEGFVTGLLFSMGFWCLLTFIPYLNMSIIQAIIFGLVCGVLGVLGDLVESRIKRNSGFKDSGTIMPGHGGLFDRCDSQFIVTIAAAVLLLCGGCIPYIWA